MDIVFGFFGIWSIWFIVLVCLWVAGMVKFSDNRFGVVFFVSLVMAVPSCVAWFWLLSVVRI